MNLNFLVTAKPFASLKYLFLKSKYKNNMNNTFFFLYGRDALLYGLKKNGVEAGSTIIIPAYMCKSTLEPIINYGFNIIFQDIDNDLNLDLTLLKENIIKHNAAAVLSVNYFGFKSNIRDVGKLCSSLEIISIEDCSHSYMSYDHFYSPIEDSNFAIYSIRKSLPIYDGGALRFSHNEFKKAYNNNASLAEASLKMYIRLYYKHYKYLTFRFFEFLIIKIRIFNLYSELLTKIKNIIRRDNLNKKPYKFNKPSQPSFILESYINNTDREDNIKKIVVKNYSEIMSAITSLGYKPLYSKLPHKCIPQYAIFYDDSGKLVNFLRNNKIGASRWPDYEIPDEVASNVSKFPKANFFNRNLVMIPIHRSINYQHRKKIIDTISLWKIAKS